MTVTKYEIDALRLYNCVSKTSHLGIASRSSRKLNKYSDDDNRNVMWMEERKERTNEKCDTEDEILAHRLQNEFNQEYNTMLKNVEDKFNRDSKGDNEHNGSPLE